MEIVVARETLLKEESLYRVALTRIKGIGPAYTRQLIEQFGDAASVFRAKNKVLLQGGIRDDVAAAIENFRITEALKRELLVLEQKGVRLLFFTDKDYPRRLNDAADTPPLLFYKGNADLNAKRIVAVVGTRIPSEYGRRVTAQLIRQIACPDLLVISGLALGIDAAAHQATLDNRLPTVGVLGHGFGQLYPTENRELAKAMLHQGGLLTSFPYGVKPETYHFPIRNKLVGALCDALIVVETARKGGSLLTVNEALQYNRKVFAVPGRIMDTRSTGCNWLIQQGKATMLTAGEQVSAAMGWSWPKGRAGFQHSLRLSSAGGDGIKPEDHLLELLKQKDSLDIDEIATLTGLAPSPLALLLVGLELKGSIYSLPGKRYRISEAGILS